jgi:hypothetical protein
MRVLADETGGFALVDSGEFDKSVEADRRRDK